MFEEFKIKGLLKKEITVEMYEKLSPSIKNDDRIIQKFISNDPNHINFVSPDKVLEIVKNNYVFCKFLNADLMNEIFSQIDISKINLDEKIFSTLNIGNKRLVLKNNPVLYYSLLSNEELRAEFDRMAAQMNSKNNGYVSNQENVIELNKIREILLSLSPDKIAMIVENGTINSKNMVRTIISTLSSEEQLNLYNANNNLYGYLAADLQEDIQIIQCEGRLDKILKLPVEIQVKYFLANIEQLQFVHGYSDAEDREINDVVKQVISSKGVLLTADQFRKITYNKYMMRTYFEEISANNALSSEELLKLLNGGGVMANEYGWSIRFCPKNLINLKQVVDLNLSKINDIEKRKLLKDIFDSVVRTSDDFDAYYNMAYKMTSMFLDEKILQNNDASLLQRYSETEDREILIQILSNAYGDHVREILDARPQLSYYEIPNFKIFESSIIEELGIEFVNYILTYDYNRFGYELSLIATDSEKMATFKKLWNYTLSKNEKVDAHVIYDIMDNFCLHEKLLSQLDFDNMSEEQKRKFELFLNDSYLAISSVNSLDDLDNYFNIRNAAFSERINQSDDNYEIRELIFEYLTGRQVDDDKGTIANMGINNVMSVFNVNNIIKNPELINSIGLNDDEVALLLLMNQIQHIGNPQVLKDVFLSLCNAKELNPINFRPTFDKISDYYIDKFKSELTDSEKLAHMQATTIEGIPVITFDGDPFNMLCSVSGLYMSINRTAVGKTQECTDDLLSEWLNLENGSSTISCMLCCSDITLNSEVVELMKEHITLVFDSNVEVVGMGGSDIASSHRRRNPVHGFEFIGHNKMRYATMEGIKQDMTNSISEMNRTGMQKFPSEISVHRREEDIRKVDKTPARLMPIGMYVLGDITEEHLKVAKTFAEYYKKENIGEFRIIRVDPEKYRGTFMTDYMLYPTSQQTKVQSNVSWYQDAQESINRGKK